jgi:hypothetical protein
MLLRAAPSRYAKAQTPNDFPYVRRSSSPVATLQSSLGNFSFGLVSTPAPQVQRSCCSSCAGGGPCETEKREEPMNFSGELDNGVFAIGPDGGRSPVPLAGPDAGTPIDAGPAAGDCTSLCSRAYADPHLNQGGGGVVCEKGVKCACVFDVSPLHKGDCPKFDAIVLAHETRHLPESDCAANAPLSRLGPKPGVDLTAQECTHRKESIAEMDAILPDATGACKTGMTSIRAGLAAWVAAHCGGGSGSH